MAKKQKTQPTPKLKRPTRLIDQYRMNEKGDLVKYQVDVPINFVWEPEEPPTEGITEDERDGGIPD